MKYAKGLSFVIAMLLVSNAFAQVKAGTIMRKQVMEEQDSVVFYETDFTSRQKSYLNLLAGTWTINTMKRQARMNAETLSRVTLNIKADSTFTGTAGCNSISGRFSIKGTSIKFKDIVATKMACEQLEQETWFLKLLQNTVSNYAVGKQALVLKDGSANAVFEGTRRE
jgi:heat shock protein HslJ